jgi:uncharacterized protein YqgC (DUF456 family)
MEVSHIILWGLAIISLIAGLIGLAAPVLPGPPLLFLAVLFAAWAEDFSYAGFWTLLIIAILALIAVVLDFIAGSLGAKKFGAGRAASIGAALGVIAGFFFGIAGMIIGPFAGAFIAELMVQKKLGPAGEAGIGAWFGLILGTAAKIALGFTMISIYIFIRFLS